MVAIVLRKLEISDGWPVKYIDGLSGSTEQPNDQQLCYKSTGKLWSKAQLFTNPRTKLYYTSYNGLQNENTVCRRK